MIVIMIVLILIIAFLIMQYINLSKKSDYLKNLKITNDCDNNGNCNIYENDKIVEKWQIECNNGECHAYDSLNSEQINFKCN